MISSDLLKFPTAQQLVRGCAERFPDIPAVVNTLDGDCSLTYSQLARVVFTAAARWEHDLRGRVVLVRGALDEHLIVDLLALLCAGAIVHPVPPNTSVEVLAHTAVQLGAVAVRADGIDLPGAANVKVLPPAAWKPSNAEPGEQRPDDVASYFRTSGTSGLPKVAVLTHEAVFTGVAITNQQILGKLDLAPGSVTVPLLPAHHVLGTVAAVLTAMEHGCTLGCAHNMKNMPVVMQHYQPRILVTVPMIVEGIWKLSQSARMKAAGMGPKELLGGHVGYLVCGAAPLPSLLISSLSANGIRVLNGYGMTECSGVVSCQTSPEEPVGGVGLSMGEVIRTRVVDGQLQVAGPTLMSGYLVDGKPDCSPVSSGWLATGDLAEIRPDGEIILTGRSKNIIILGDGNNVSPEQIERELTEFPSVVEAVVTAEPLGLGGRDVLAATCVCDEIADVEVSEYPGIRVVGRVPQSLVSAVVAVNSQAPAYRQIRVVRVAPSDVPRSDLGKIVRRKLTWQR
ncbi:hypothetical protein HMPREF1531_00703 [Propionibacterium sp. oral taxon 192 str. F0372]|uniref:AMP-binding protein n=1 Tax=Propionibacterium sp. oral taxon 192 TaxID=671222 RepID=UPI000353F14A|nr:class I adenylate-forming enzyme family protein [Propionibacterium sp. oral taxon 192]EPH06055.1 hypothetical protein HMPREF1531_00703 [Propionibacterium sp. oral taxon 192 str. F0372]